MEIIAHIENDFTEKFGVPRQSGIAENIISKIVFEPEYRIPEAVRGLEQYSHIWILWQFSDALRDKWKPTVRPPRLGGNIRMGVFATRSPFRPNSIGLSSVKIVKIDMTTKQGAVIYVSGADMMNNTPVIDIKPYLAYTDSHADAKDGFALSSTANIVRVEFPQNLLELIPDEKHSGLISVLAQNPVPQYQHNPNRIYSMKFSNYDISFKTDGKILTVTNIRTCSHRRLSNK